MTDDQAHWRALVPGHGRFAPPEVGYSSERPASAKLNCRSNRHPERYRFFCPVFRTLITPTYSKQSNVHASNSCCMQCQNTQPPSWRRSGLDCWLCKSDVGGLRTRRWRRHGSRDSGWLPLWFHLTWMKTKHHVHHNALQRPFADGVLSFC